MGYARNPWARTPWALQGDLTNVTPPGWQDTPGGSYAYSAQPGIGAWALRSWGGMVGVPVYAAGGIAVSADPGLGVVSIRAWWPNAPALQLVRITPDGVRHPVRGGYPVVPPVPTRTNLCTNPSVETATTGWLAGNAQTTIARTAVAATRHNLCPNPSAELGITGWTHRSPTNPAIVSVSQAGTGFVGTKSVTATATAAGTGGVVLPVGGGVVAGSTYTVSVYAKGPAAGLTFNPFVDWLDASGNYISTSAGTPVFTGTSWARLSVSATAPAGAVSVRPFATTGGMIIGDVVQYDAALYEVAALASYFDGDTIGAVWDGQEDNSTSSLPDPTYVAAGSYTLRLTSTSTTTGALVPGTLPGPSGRAYTIGFGLAVSTRPTAVTITVPWLDTVGAGAGTSTVNLSTDAINQSVGAGARQVVTVVAPAAAATGSVRLTVDGITANVTTTDIDAWTIEAGVTDGSYFDGTSQGGSWTGAAHLSTSLLAPVMIVIDGEAPFDTALRYEVYSPAITGGRAAAQPVVLTSAGLTWLTHPAAPSAPFVVQLSAPTPARVYDLDQGVFYPIGRSRPIVVSAAQRHAATGTLTFGATTRTELRTLLATLADASPVLLRMPGDWDPGDMWVALGGLTVDPQGRLPYQDTRLIVAPFTEVDPPDAALVA